MEYNFNVQGQGKERKALVTAVSEILQADAVYQKAPTYAYTIGKYTVHKNGVLIGRANAKLERLLQERGFTPTVNDAERAEIEAAVREHIEEMKATDEPEHAEMIEETLCVSKSWVTCKYWS